MMHMQGEETQTSFASAPSSPGRSEAPSYFFSALASPTHFLLSSSSFSTNSAYSIRTAPDPDPEQADFEFYLPARSMSTAEELFFNGQIRPGFISSDQACIHRRTRSVSPTRKPHMHLGEKNKEFKPKLKSVAGSINQNTTSELIRKSGSTSASTSRSSSSNSSMCNLSNASSRRWGFIKDLLALQRCKSEGRLLSTTGAASKPGQREQNNDNRNYCTNGCKGSRNSNRNKNKSMIKSTRQRTTFLPYKQQGFLFGCMGFRSRGFMGNFSILSVSSRQS